MSQKSNDDIKISLTRFRYFDGFARQVCRFMDYCFHRWIGSGFPRHRVHNLATKPQQISCSYFNRQSQRDDTSDERIKGAQFITRYETSTNTVLLLIYTTRETILVMNDLKCKLDFSLVSRTLLFFLLLLPALIFILLYSLLILSIYHTSEKYFSRALIG